MTTENDFIPFAVGGSANVISQATYAADTTLTQGGFTAGIATSAQLNKVWRQSSIMAAVIASFIVAETGQTAIDDGTTATLLANFTNAVNAASKNKIVLTDTGTANAYAAANPVPLTALPTATGFTQTVKIAHLNTGTSTYAPDGLATAPIYGLGGAVLQGGELPVNGVATLVSFVDPLLNSGNLCWVLYECVGGAQQVAPATASQHAVQLGQVGHGQCRLSMTSATVVTLKPFNGNNLIINGVPQQIPSAGITLTNSGLTASAVYYIYAAMVSGVMTLVASTTGHSTASNGVETMTGDITKTLVGMVMPNTSGQFQLSGIWLGLLNWFQRQDVECHVSEPGTPLTTSSTSAFVQLSAAFTITFLAWNVADMRSSGYVSNSSVATSSFLIGIDSVTTGSAVNTFASSSAGFDGSVGVTAKFTLAEGAHFAACCGKVTAGTASYTPDIEVIVQG